MPTGNKTTDWAFADENGNLVLDFTSMISVEISDEGKVLSEPVERGGFASYNKTNTPLAVRAEVGVQGEADALQSFLDRLGELKKSVTVFSLITPEQEYKSLTLESFRYQRKREDGLAAIYAEMLLVEVAEVMPQYANVKLPPSQTRNPENASAADTGKAQTSTEQPAPASEQGGHDSILSRS